MLQKKDHGLASVLSYHRQFCLFTTPFYFRLFYAIPWFRRDAALLLSGCRWRSAWHFLLWRKTNLLLAQDNSRAIR